MTKSTMGSAVTEREMEEEVASPRQEHPQPTSGIPFSDLGLGESRASLPLFSYGPL